VHSSPTRAVGEVTRDVLAEVARSPVKSEDRTPNRRRSAWTAPLDQEPNTGLRPQAVAEHVGMGRAAGVHRRLRRPVRGQLDPGQRPGGSFDLAVSSFRDPADAPSRTSSCATRWNRKRSRSVWPGDPKHGGPPSYATRTRRNGAFGAELGVEGLAGRRSWRVRVEWEGRDRCRLTRTARRRLRPVAFPPRLRECSGGPRPGATAEATAPVSYLQKREFGFVGSGATCAAVSPRDGGRGSNGMIFSDMAPPAAAMPAELGGEGAPARPEVADRADA